MLPRLGASKLVSTWILITLCASIFAALDGGWLAGWTALAPARIWRGEVWRLATWLFVETGPMSLVWTCIAIFKFGTELAVRWGDRRLHRFVVQILLGAGVVTCLLTAVAGGYFVPRLGGWAVADVLVIAWARQFPDRTLTIYNVLRLQGQQIVNITIGVAIVFAIYFGPVATAPELFACIAAAAYRPGWLRR